MKMKRPLGQMIKYPKIQAIYQNNLNDVWVVFYYEDEIFYHVVILDRTGIVGPTRGPRHPLPKENWQTLYWSE